LIKPLQCFQGLFFEFESWQALGITPAFHEADVGNFAGFDDEAAMK